jgi:hypothetical protein
VEFEQRGPLRRWSEIGRVDALEQLSSRNSVTTGGLAETENRCAKRFWNWLDFLEQEPEVRS